MSRCRDCKHSNTSPIELKNKYVDVTVCTLNSQIVSPDNEHDCGCYNRDLSEYDICYNCKYYRGGGDWGLFCSHDDMYHHLGRFDDEPCERYEKK